MERSGVRYSVVFYGAMTLVAALLAALAALPSLFTPPLDLERGLGSIAIGVGLALLVVYGGRRLEGRPWYARMGEVLRAALVRIVGPRASVADVFLMASSSAIGEEALYRGLLQPWLGRLVADRLLHSPDAAPGVGWALATLVFGLTHAPFHRDLMPWTAFALVFGGALGGLAAWSGSLAASVVAHFVVNFLNLRRLLAEGAVAQGSRR